MRFKRDILEFDRELKCIATSKKGGEAQIEGVRG
jgi:hypothetical protein